MIFRNFAVSPEYVQALTFPPEAEIFLSFGKQRREDKIMRALGPLGAIFGGGSGLSFRGGSPPSDPPYAHV